MLGISEAWYLKLARKRKICLDFPMSKPKIDLEIIATVKSAAAVSQFADYIQSLDERLTDAEALGSCCFLD